MARYRPFVQSMWLPLGTALFACLLFAGITQAQEPPGGPPPHEYEVVASGLDNPRGLTFGADGALFIAEAGRGGEGPCMPGPEGGNVCFGMTGTITRVQNGEQERIATDLPSIAAEGSEQQPGGSSASGPHDVSFDDDGNTVVIIGLGADPAVRDRLGEEGAHFGQLLQISASGEPGESVDIAAYEAESNPDGGVADTNPYSVVVTPQGERIVVDAGGNALLSVGGNGEISTVAVFADRMVSAPPFLGLPPETEMPMQSVPTSVAIGPDGAYYVGELTGFPFLPGEAKVYRVEPGQEPEVYAEGFTNIVDIAFDEEGELYVLEIATNGLTSGDMTGAVKRADGTVVASDGLFMPGGLAVGPDGALYVSNCGVCPGAGEVIRIEP